MPSVNWGTSALTFAGVQRVYTRQHWASWNGSSFDEVAWTLQSNIWCEELNYTLLPSMPTATLILNYGRVLPHGTTALATQAKLDIRGYFVKIEVDCPDGTLSWFGFVDEQVDEQGGSSSFATGRQTFVCYAMPQMLAHQFMTYSMWHDEPNSALRQSGSSIPFNQKGRPNRTQTIPTIGSLLPSHVFAPIAPINRLQVARPWAKPRFWSSRDILTYVQEYLTPLDANGRKVIPIRFDGLTNVPNWDRPTLQTEGRSVLSLINQIVDQSRGLAISTEVDTTTTPDTVVLTVHSTSSTALSLPDSRTHPANADTLTIVTTAAQDTNVTIQSSTTAIAHQIVVKGAKRETCLTTQIQATAGTTHALAEGWSTTKVNAYNTAASGETGYAAKTKTEKQVVNAIVRGKDELDDVFKTFVLYPNWNRELVTTAGSKSWVFQADNPDYDSGATPPDPDAEKYIEYFPWWQELLVSNVLPFKEDFDYTGSSPVSDEDAEPQFRSPYVLFKRPGKTEFMQAEKMSNGVDPSFSVGIGHAKDEQGIRLDVLGTHQHSIAESTYVPLADDPPIDGEWDYKDCYFTISLIEDRYAEGRYPADEDLSTSVDLIRQKVIYVGDAYRQVRLAGNVTIDVENDGTRQETDPGLLKPGDFLVDNASELQSLAQIAAAWYLTDRKVLRLVSARPSATPAVGQMLTTSNSDSINTIVSEISVQTPLGINLAPTPPSYRLTTAKGELDPLAFIPPRGLRRRKPTAPPPGRSRRS